MVSRSERPRWIDEQRILEFSQHEPRDWINFHTKKKNPFQSAWKIGPPDIIMAWPQGHVQASSSTNLIYLRFCFIAHPRQHTESQIWGVAVYWVIKVAVHADGKLYSQLQLWNAYLFAWHAMSSQGPTSSVDCFYIPPAWEYLRGQWKSHTLIGHTRYRGDNQAVTPHTSLRLIVGWHQLFDCWLPLSFGPLIAANAIEE